MKYTGLTLIVFCFSFSISAQDTSRLDLGRVQLRKEFVQGITLKASDLDQYPYLNLADAVRSWLYGLNHTAHNLTWVVDGNLIEDINVYDMTDIEEITLVQNASAQSNGATQQDHLILVKTKKRQAKGNSLQVHGSTHLTKRDLVNPYFNSKDQTESHLYHRYGISAQTRTDRLNAGISLGYARDVMPEMSDPAYVYRTPRNIDRYRFNGFASYQLHADHILSGRLNYTAQEYAFERTLQGGNFQFDDNYSNMHFLSGGLGLHSRIGGGWTNDLNAAYAWTEGESSAHSSINTTPAISTNGHFTQNFNNLLLRNTIRYRRLKADWEFSPALNLSFRRLNEEGSGFSRTLEGQNVISMAEYRQEASGNKFIATPSFDVSFRRSLNLHAGLVTDLSSKKTHTFYPFVSATIDLAKLIDSANNYSLRLFGSYSSWGELLDVNYTLGGLYYNPVSAFNPYLLLATTGFPANNRPDSSFSTLQGGISGSFFNERLTVSYNYENRDYSTHFYMPVNINGNIITILAFDEARTKMHRVQVGYQTKSSRLSWRTNFHINSMKTSFESQPMWIIGGPVAGDVNTSHPSWATGWNNRLSYKGFSLGTDLLARFNKETRINLFTTKEHNEISVQHVFLAYHFQLKRTKGVEVYISSRNTYQNDYFAYWNDSRRYYGVGFRVDF